MSLPLALQDAAAQVSTAASRLPLWGNLSLADPWFLLLLPPALVALWHGRRSKRHAAGRVPSLAGAGVTRSLAQRCAWLVSALQLAALVLSVFALARPLRGNVELSSTTEGIDICLVIDRSSSMDAQEFRGAPTRFEIVKDVVGDFAARRMSDREGAADNVGIVTFALYPELLLPFTLDVDALTGVLTGLETEKSRELDATGIGIAMAKATSLLRESEARSRIVVLLTDGIENVEAIQPLEAAQLAAEEGIKVYTVFAGPRAIVRRGLFGNQTKIPIDTRELERVAEITGARFYHAEDKSDLEQVYAEIEGLERTEREESRYAENFDLYPSLLLPAFLLYLLSILSAATWARRLP